MQQALAQQLADQEAHAARRVEVVHVGLAIRIDARHQRHGLRQFGEILPRHHNARRRRHGDDVHGVVGRTARRQKPHHAVDHRLLVEDAADGPVIVAKRGDRQRLLGRGFGDGVAQGRAGIDEGRARQMQAHDFHQHLVGIGGAVKGAGAGAMIGLRLGFKQVFAADLALRIELADLALFVVGQARCHRSRRNEHGGQMAKRQGPHDEAGDDLVADAQIHRSIEHLVRQGNGGGERDDIAREQRQFHAGLALGHAIAHGRNATRHLRRAARRAGRDADHFGVSLEGLMRRQHVVERRDDAEVRPGAVAQFVLVMGTAGGKAMGDVGAAQRLAFGLARHGFIDAGQIARPRNLAARHDGFGNIGYCSVNGHSISFQGHQ